MEAELYLYMAMALSSPAKPPVIETERHIVYPVEKKVELPPVVTKGKYCTCTPNNTCGCTEGRPCQCQGPVTKIVPNFTVQQQQLPVQQYQPQQSYYVPSFVLPPFQQQQQFQPVQQNTSRNC